MEKDTLLERYLESLKGLPSEVQRNFTMLKDLDKKVEDITRDVDKRKTTYLSKAKTQNRRERLQSIRAIKDQLKKGRSISDQKVQLAMQTYETVDRHIRQLDSDLSRFEAEIRDTLRKGTQNRKIKVIAQEPNNRKKKKQTAGNESAHGGLGSHAGLSAVRSSAAGSGSHIPASASLVLTLTNNPSEVLDMPVDPNEPTYCLCHQVSYGEMVGCDNPDCHIEWFHFGCVGLVDKPKGKWYCPRCLEERRFKKRDDL